MNSCLSQSCLSLRFIFQIFTTILIVSQIVANTTHAFNDLSTSTLDPNYNNIEEDDDSAGVVSFDLPYHFSYPTGGEFGKGAIDLGGLEVHAALYFKKIWSINNGGPNGVGASFYEPVSLPFGFHLLGHYCRPNSNPISTAVLTVKDTTGHMYSGSLRPPLDYSLIWSSKGLNVKKYKDLDAYIWTPIPPTGYNAIGHIVTTSPAKPSINKVRCVRADFTDLSMVDEWVWGVKMSRNSVTFNVHTTKPISEGLSVPSGMFLAQVDSFDIPEIACLKMVKSDPYSAMPNSLQIQTMIKAYAPIVYFHPDEEYLPSSVLWFFQNGAELHRSGQISRVINDGQNLPSYGSQDDSFLDLPIDQANHDRVKNGYLPNASAYIHVKSALGGTFTDLVIWLYYPFNGGGKFQLGPFTINLGKIGEHVSDWEHMTLRIDNFNGHLKAIYLSRHSTGVWVTPQEFELLNGTRPVVYASLHSHSHYNTPSYHLHSTVEVDASDMEVLHEVLQMDSRKLMIVRGEKFLGFGVRDDTAKSDNMMDVASSYQIVCVDHMASNMEPWLNYTGRWGPKITYDIPVEIRIITKRFPFMLRFLVKKLLNKLLQKLPELFGEEGPVGPKMKESWTGDEST